MQRSCNGSVDAVWPVSSREFLRADRHVEHCAEQKHRLSFGKPSLTADENKIEGALWLADFRGDEFAQLQRWEWNATAGTLSRSGEGHCLGAEAPERENVNVWSRQLSNGSIVLVFVNAEISDAKRTVRCDWSDCLGQTGLSPSAKVTARDLVRDGVAPVKFTAKDGVGVSVEGGGGSTTILLTTQ